MDWGGGREHLNEFLETENMGMYSLTINIGKQIMKTTLLDGSLFFNKTAIFTKVNGLRLLPLVSNNVTNINDSFPHP